MVGICQCSLRFGDLVTKKHQDTTISLHPLSFEQASAKGQDQETKKKENPVMAEKKPVGAFPYETENPSGVPGVTDEQASAKGQDQETKKKENPVMAEKKPVGAFPYETENPSGVPGVTEISDGVIAAIVGRAAEQVKGVMKLGTGGLLRAVIDTARSTGAAMAAGVEVEAGRREAIFDIDLTIEYGHSIPDIVKDVRESVATELKEQVGLVAKEINVSVAAIEFPQRIPTGRVE